MCSVETSENYIRVEIGTKIRLGLGPALDFLVMYRAGYSVLAETDCSVLETWNQ